MNSQYAHNISQGFQSFTPSTYQSVQSQSNQQPHGSNALRSSSLGHSGVQSYPSRDISWTSSADSSKEDEEDSISTLSHTRLTEFRNPGLLRTHSPMGIPQSNISSASFPITSSGMPPLASPSLNSQTGMGLKMSFSSPNIGQTITNASSSTDSSSEIFVHEGITYNNRGYEICGQHNQHNKPCQRIGNCPFHRTKPKSRRETYDQERIKDKKSPQIKKYPYKQGWSKDEHLRFLNGLCAHGKGAWKEISAIVGTRSPTQIQSHAQKYYLRQKQEVRNKRSIHDLSLSDLKESGNSSPPPSGMGSMPTPINFSVSPSYEQKPSQIPGANHSTSTQHNSSSHPSTNYSFNSLGSSQLHSQTSLGLLGQHSSAGYQTGVQNGQSKILTSPATTYNSNYQHTHLNPISLNSLKTEIAVQTPARNQVDDEYGSHEQNNYQRLQANMSASNLSHYSQSPSLSQQQHHSSRQPCSNYNQSQSNYYNQSGLSLQSSNDHGVVYTHSTLPSLAPSRTQGLISFQVGGSSMQTFHHSAGLGSSTGSNTPSLPSANTWQTQQGHYSENRSNMINY